MRLKEEIPRIHFPQWAIGLMGSVVIIGLVTLLLKKVESNLQIQLIALLYMLPVLGCTVLWGLTFGILTGLLSFLVFNYYSRIRIPRSLLRTAR
jgi:K+-sensing histidine kinase KdpD